MVPNALQPGQFNFDVVRRLGEGGLGIVDEIRISASNAWDKPVGSAWARKMLNEQWREHPEIRARFEREIATLHTLSHANIVRLEGVNVHPGAPRFYVMPLYRGSFRNVLRQAVRFPWRDVAGFAIRIGKALTHAHDRNVVHRDLKPENILWDDANRWAIADWGLGGFVHKHSRVLDLTHAGLGTEYYASLEQWTTGESDARTDVYSLGMMIAEFVRGERRGLPGYGVPDDLIVATTRATQAFNIVVKRMTAWHRDQRYTNIGDAVAELEGTLQLPDA